MATKKTTKKHQFFDLIIPVRLTFAEEVLGSQPGDAEIYQNFIASKAPDAKTMEEEIAMLGEGEVIEKGMTFFPKDKGKHFCYDYQLKGMIKDACGKLSRKTGSECKAIKAYKKIVDGCIFIVDEDGQPSRINYYNLPEGGRIGLCERPLRASTAQGERISLASSETIPAGTTLEFCIGLMEINHEKFVREILDYGLFGGFGQWRNSGKGRFTWEEKIDGEWVPQN